MSCRKIGLVQVTDSTPTVAEVRLEHPVWKLRPPQEAARAWALKCATAAPLDTSGTIEPGVQYNP